MLNLLTTLYAKIEQLKGKKLVILLMCVFIVFLLIGLGFGYITNKVLNKTEQTEFVNTQETPSAKQYYQGRVVYVNPNLYPNDKISYMLADENGNEIILLKSKDQKLVVTEGHTVKALGKVLKTKIGDKEYLMVEEIIIQNGVSTPFGVQNDGSN